ncbi:UNVERIFIED_CONTAM: hypothetical protein Sangu_2413700 [Sesamum angustifolium]|uniref:Uncharacterized protein n=1 Tax=Sesamum angustifolium TaxID=2727405 RepID=A0AAW2KVY9_9LAMI
MGVLYELPSMCTLVFPLASMTPRDAMHVMVATKKGRALREHGRSKRRRCLSMA